MNGVTWGQNRVFLNDLPGDGFVWLLNIFRGRKEKRGRAPSVESQQSLTKSPLGVSVVSQLGDDEDEVGLAGLGKKYNVIVGALLLKVRFMDQ